MLNSDLLTTVIQRVISAIQRNLEDSASNVNLGYLMDKMGYILLYSNLTSRDKVASDSSRIFSNIINDLYMRDVLSLDEAENLWVMFFKAFGFSSPDKRAHELALSVKSTFHEFSYGSAAVSGDRLTSDLAALVILDLDIERWDWCQENRNGLSRLMHLIAITEEHYSQENICTHVENELVAMVNDELISPVTALSFRANRTELFVKAWNAVSTVEQKISLVHYHAYLTVNDVDLSTVNVDDLIETIRGQKINMSPKILSTLILGENPSLMRYSKEFGALVSLPWKTISSVRWSLLD